MKIGPEENDPPPVYINDILGTLTSNTGVQTLPRDTMASPTEENGEYSYIPSSFAGQLNPSVDEASGRNDGQTYEYVHLETMPENARPQSQHNSQENTPIAQRASDAEARINQSRESPKTSTIAIQTAESLTNSSRHQSSNSNSSSGNSELYLKPTNHESVRESDGSGVYEYTDAVTVLEVTTKPSCYIGLSARPPQRPNVYDRLRQSTLNPDT